MSKIPFSVSARTARLIGRENVANAEGALIELVKNCYDADSNDVIVLIDKPSNQIAIIDFGDGMTDQIITEQWMTIGTDDKLNNAITSTGRIKSGAKGIGRFALDRLGESCTMITFPKTKNIGFKWEVNWSDFEQKNKDGRNININEVFADISLLENTSYYNELLNTAIDIQALKKIEEIQNDKNKVVHSGTALIIKNLRDSWDDSYIAKVYQTLELLNPPEGLNKINIWVISGEFPEKYGLVDNEEFKDYDYKLVANYKKNKEKNPEYEVEIKIHRNEFDFNLIDKRLFDIQEMQSFPFDIKTFEKEEFEIKRRFTELMKGFKDEKDLLKNIGDFEFTFYFLKNTFSSIDRKKYFYKDFLGNRGKWIEKFGGIKLYRDDFRVRPYGEIGTQAYDWLMLGERFSLNPAGFARKGSRVRPTQVAGAVKFSRLDNPYLEDQSNREGIPETDTFTVFKNLLLGIIKVQEDDRSTIGFNLNKLYYSVNELEKIIAESEKIAQSEEDSTTESQEDTRKKNKTLQTGFKAITQRLEEKEDELATSRAMASAGIMIASFSHEFHGIKNDLSSRTKDLRKYLKEVIDYEKLKNIPDRKNPLKLIDEFQKQDDKIRQWIEFSVELTKKDRRKNKKVDLKEYFDGFRTLWAKLFEQRVDDFSVNYGENKTFSLKISELDLDTIFDNLITNSIEAFDSSGFSGIKKIAIDLENIGDDILIRYYDTGPGISKTYSNINDIFTPFETSKKDDLGNDIGTGLGMWLVKSSIDSNKGQVELIRPKIGFEIKIYFKAIKN